VNRGERHPGRREGLLQRVWREHPRIDVKGLGAEHHAGAMKLTEVAQ